MIGRVALGAAALTAAATSASAQQTQTYTYDVHGRLTGVTRTTGSTSRTTTYALDKADNRTSRAVNAPIADLMNAPSTAMQSQSPVETQAAPQGAEDEKRESQVVQDASPKPGGAQ